MLSTSHATNLRLADIVTAFRNINECYRNIRTLGTEGFTVSLNDNVGLSGTSVQEMNYQIIQSKENLPSNIPIALSTGSTLLQTILTYWYSINDNMKLIDMHQDLSVLRPYTIQTYNEARSVQASVPPHDIASHIFLLRGRHYACTLLSHIYTSGTHSTAALSSPIPESCRCWLRTALAWESLYQTTVTPTLPISSSVPEYLRDQVKQSYRAALQYHETGGGTTVLSRLLIGIELETHMQVIMDCLIGYTRILWKEITATVQDKVSTNSPSHQPTKTELQRLLLHDAVQLIPYVPHERLPLVKIMMDMGQSYLDYRKFTDAEVWLQATLTLMDTNEAPSSTATNPEYDSLKNHLLLSLASCTVEQVMNAKTEGRLSDHTDTTTSTPVSSTTVSLPSSIGKITGYLAAARGERTVIGQHLLVQVACLQNRIDDALHHLHELINLASKADETSRVPLFRGPGTTISSENIQVSPHFHLLTSALRTFAITRNFDLVAMKEYGNVATVCYSQTPEIGLLRHDLLVSLLVSLSVPIAKMDNHQPVPTVLPYKALQDPRVEWTLNRIIDDNNNGKCPVTLFVRESILKILQDGIQSAYEAKEWTVCLSFIDRLFSFVGTSSSDPSKFSSERYGYYYRTKATALFELQKYTDALGAINEAIRHHRTVAPLFLRLRIVAKLTDTIAHATSTSSLPSLAHVFQELTSAPDFSPIHLLAAVQELTRPTATDTMMIDNENTHPTASLSPSDTEKLRIAESAIDTLFRTVPDYNVCQHHATLRTITLVRLAMNINQKLHASDPYTEGNFSTLLQCMFKVSERIRTCRPPVTNTNDDPDSLALLRTTTGNVTDFLWTIHTVWNLAMIAWTKKYYCFSVIAANFLAQFTRTTHDMVRDGTNHDNHDGNTPEYRTLYSTLSIVSALLRALNHYALGYNASSIVRPSVSDDPAYASLYDVCRYTPSDHLRYAQQALNEIKKEYTEDSILNVRNTLTLPLWKLIHAFLSTVNHNLRIEPSVSFVEAWGSIPLIVGTTDIQVRLLSDPVVATTPHSVSLLSPLTKLKGINPFVFDNVAEILRQPPYSQRALAYQALQFGKESALTLYRTPTMNENTRVSIEYIAACYRKLVLLAASRSESLPVFDEILQFLPASPNVTFPADELDYLGVVAWNHGCYFYRMNVLERAERFMSWTIHIIPYLESATKGRTDTVTDTSLSSSHVCLGNAKPMQKQYEHVCQLLGTQAKFSTPVPIVLDNLTSTASSILNRVSSIVNEPIVTPEPIVTSSTMGANYDTLITNENEDMVHDIPPLESVAPIEEGRNKRPYSPPASSNEKSGLTPTGKKRTVETKSTTCSGNNGNTIIEPMVTESTVLTTKLSSNTSLPVISSTESTLLVSDPLDEKDESFHELYRLDDELGAARNGKEYYPNPLNEGSTSAVSMESI